MAWRRAHKRKNGFLISPFTVNDTTEQLKKLFTRAKTWGVHFAEPPAWRDHWLKEPQERVRELRGIENTKLQIATRADLAPFFAFAKESRATVAGVPIAMVRGRLGSWADQEARQRRQARYGADHTDHPFNFVAVAKAPCRARLYLQGPADPPRQG